MPQMPHDTQASSEEGRPKSQPEETEGGEAESHQGVEGATQRNGSVPRIEPKSWDEIVNPPHPRAYTLANAHNPAGQSFYIWRGNDGQCYSPVFTDENKAAEYPESNLFRLFTGEELAKQVKEDGLA
jgi:hypothetical protein